MLLKVYIMKIWEVKGLGLDNLALVEKNNKSIADNEILVEMKAATLNYRDLIMIDGGYGPIGGTPPYIPISDGSGIVKKIGKSVKKFNWICSSLLLNFILKRNFIC